MKSENIFDIIESLKMWRLRNEDNRGVLDLVEEN